MTYTIPDQSTGRLEHRLLDPGLVLNCSTGEHCVHACFQMVFRTRLGCGVPSFSELDSLMGGIPGKYRWEHGLIAEMPKFGFDVSIIWSFDLERLATNPSAALIEHYGPVVGQETIDKSDMITVAAGAERLLSSSALIERRSPSSADLRQILSNGYYVLLTINQRTLQADPGYVAHNVFVFGYSPRGVLIHNPGPPATCGSEIAWDLMEKAWAYPDDRARNIMAFRPSQDA